MMHMDNTSSCYGNDCFYGYAIDLLEAMANDLSFFYEIYVVPDGKYGAMNEITRTWNGMMAELIPDDNGKTVSSLWPVFRYKHS